MDRILIRDLRVDTRIGVTDEERAALQPVYINIELSVDATRAGDSDDISDTVDYGAVALAVAELARGSENKLLEHLGSQIASLLAGIRGVLGVTVEIAKKQPPVPEDVGAVAVRIERAGR
jgi:dihydroneopterin aldolase